MVRSTRRTPEERGIYTLGQIRTENTANPTKKPIEIKGLGCDLTEGSMINLPRRKYITQLIALGLVTVAEKKGRNMKDIQHYWNAYHCLDEVMTSKNKVFGNYCRCRFCTVCVAIHKAELINKYLPIIEQWEDAHFVTLTVPAISKNKLNVYMQDLMIRGMRKIIEKYRKPHERGKGKKLIGIRSLECCFNPKRYTYNPHFHLIVPDRETGDIFIEEWLNLWASLKPSIKAQHIRPVRGKDIEKDMIETIKYGTKIFTDPTGKKFKTGASPMVYLSAMDNILTAMKGKRLFEHFGFKVAKPIKTKSNQITDDYKDWKFDPENSDWINFDNFREVLCGYKISKKMKAILDNNINSVLQ